MRSNKRKLITDKLRAAIHKAARNAIALIFAVFLAGCMSAGLPKPIAESGGYQHPPVLMAEQASPPQSSLPSNDGSLFSPQVVQWSPWRDNTASAVGDIVTVRISVDNQAQNSASTGLSRSSKMSAGITALLGYETSLPGVGSDEEGDPNYGTSPAQLIKTESSSAYDGEGDTSRRGKMVADISAIVTHVYPNGNMVIHGSQSLLINNERSLLTVDGVIRPSDIAINNVVESDRIANAQIEVTGRGILSDKQRPGLLMRAFDWVWPF